MGLGALGLVDHQHAASAAGAGRRHLVRRSASPGKATEATLDEGKELLGADGAREAEHDVGPDDVTAVMRHEIPPALRDHILSPPETLTDILQTPDLFSAVRGPLHLQGRYRVPGQKWT